MVESILGARIRERRRRAGITQSELARRIGISASYLNLIERNKRRIAGPLLVRTAEELGAEISELDGASERRLVETLHEIAHLPALVALEVETESTGEMLGRYPGWARALAALARAEHDASQAARQMADRLTHDPFLAETVHRMLSRVAAVRSAVEILTDFDDIEPHQRNRFTGIIRDEAAALTEIGEALATYFEKTEAADERLTPLDEVEALLESNGNHFAKLDAAGAELSGLVNQRQPMPPLVAAHAIAQEFLAGAVGDIIDKAPQLETTAARNRARQVLIDYATRAILLPLDGFIAKTTERGFDIEALARQSGADVMTICQRLASLPPRHPDDAEDLPSFGYFRANASGTIIEMLGLSGLSLPRYAAACPLWALYRAQQMPETVLRQRAVFPNGRRFVFLARSRRTGAEGFNQPRHYLTDMLALSEEDAARTVYAPDTATPVEEVGPACRLCPRHTCAHRTDDPLGS
ncbi:MAG: short-chain fatty acyl-CoA regulator family protein [Pseudomonadota bacterium]